MADTPEEEAVDLAAIKVSLNHGSWVVDYGGGISRLFNSREEAIDTARDAAAIEGRELDIDSDQ